MNTHRIKVGLLWLLQHHILSHGKAVPSFETMFKMPKWDYLNLCPSEPASSSYDAEANRHFDGLNRCIWILFWKGVSQGHDSRLCCIRTYEMNLTGFKKGIRILLLSRQTLLVSTITQELHCPDKVPKRKMNPERMMMDHVPL